MRVRRAGLSAFALALAVSTASGQIAGSIHTVDATAAPRDLFSSRADISLAVGSASAPCRPSESLADGDYYFQVTDATGAKLLSTDPVSERRVTVTNGVIASYGGSTHAMGGPTACNSITISLSPYDDAGDRKVAYVVWMTPVGSFHGQPTDVGPVCGGGCFFGFLPALSTAHAFRVEDKRNCEPTFCASGTVFADADGDGALDGGEAGLADVPIHVTGPTGILLSGLSASDGTFRVCGLTSSDTWLVNETFPSGYQQTGPKDSRITRSLIAKDLEYILLVCCSDFPGLDFGNQILPGEAGGLVYEDLNANGARDPGEPPLSGATLTLTPMSPAGDPQTAVSAGDGTFLFSGLAPALYVLTQTPPAGFTQTQPVTLPGYSVDLTLGGSSLNNIFGDFRGTLTGTLAGVVFNDLNGNGVRDPGEPGMAGVTVIVGIGPLPCGIPPPGTCPQTTVTAADGSYQFTGIGFGLQYLAEIVPDGFKQTAPPPPGTLAVTLDLAHQNITDLDFGNQALPVPATSSIAGDKWIDFNENGVVDGVDYPLPEWVFVLTDANGQQRTATTDANGQYSFTNLPPGTYDLKEVLQPGFWQTFPGTKTNPLGYTIVLGVDEHKVGFRFLNKC